MGRAGRTKIARGHGKLVKSARVILESLANPSEPDGSWPALVRDYTWNGWAIPYFDEETTKAIVAVLSRAPGTRATVAADGVTIVTEEAEFPDEVFEAETINGQRLYPLGAYSWCWSIVKEEDRPGHPASPSSLSTG